MPEEQIARKVDEGLQYGQSGSSRYLSVIFCGGRAKRFGDVKTLGVVRGQPVLEAIVEALNWPGNCPTFASLGPYTGETKKLNNGLRAAYEKTINGVALTEDERELIACVLNAEEINDFVHALQLRPRFVYSTKDDSKASCIKNLADCVKGKFELDLQTYSPILKTNDPTFSAYLNYMLDKRAVTGDLLRKYGEDLNARIQENFTNRLIVAVNGDTIAIDLKGVYKRAIGDASLKLQTKNDAAFIGIFPTAVPKGEGREYLADTNGVVTHISDKDKPNVVEEAGVFIFNPAALDNIIVPQAKRLAPSQRTTEREFLPGPSWLCRELYSSGKRVYAKRYADTIFDLNSPEDYFVLRSLIRHNSLDFGDSRFFTGDKNGA